MTIPFATLKAQNNHEKNGHFAQHLRLLIYQQANGAFE